MFSIIAEISNDLPANPDLFIVTHTEKYSI